MESYGIGYGYILYETVLNRDYPDSTLSFEDIGDRAYVFVNDINIENVCDTFLNMDNFTKGFVLLNGFNLGRFWDIGPQKTLYVPASLLKKVKMKY